MDKSKRIRDSFREYATDLGKWGWAVIICWILGEFVTVALFFWGMSHAPMPEDQSYWIWLSLALIIFGLVVVPFIAYHRRRIAYIEEIEVKEREFENLKQSLSNHPIRQFVVSTEINQRESKEGIRFEIGVFIVENEALQVVVFLWLAWPISKVKQPLSFDWKNRLQILNPMKALKSGLLL